MHLTKGQRKPPLLVRHRINQVSELRDIPHEFGVEIDIRSNGHHLILAHDHDVTTSYFEDWLNEFNHPLLILNVKEEGLENKVIELISEKLTHIPEYFFLDQSFPTIASRLRSEIFDSCLRVSEFESIKPLKSLRAKWVWLDSHTGDWNFLSHDLLTYQNQGVKFCLASPELRGLDKMPDLLKLKNHLEKIGFIPDAICTKLVQEWK